MPKTGLFGHLANLALLTRNWALPLLLLGYLELPACDFLYLILSNEKDSRTEAD
jgi:hypothetical protein